MRADLKEIGFDTRNCADSAQDGAYWRVFLNIYSVMIHIQMLYKFKKDK